MSEMQIFGLYACAKLKYCILLYLILGSTIVLAKDSFFGQTNALLTSVMAAKTSDLTVKNGTFAKNLSITGLKSGSLRELKSTFCQAKATLGMLFRTHNGTISLFAS